MKKITQKLNQIATALLARVNTLYQENPVRVVSYVVSAVIALAAHFNVVLDGVETGQVVGIVLLVVFGGQVAKRKVTPV